MELKLEFLDGAGLGKYDDFLLKKVQCTMVHHSAKWLELCQEILNDELKVIQVSSRNEVVAVFPFLIRRSAWGDVINSLPMSGSPGGILIDEGISGELKRKVLLLVKESFEEFIAANNVLSYTIIQSPLSGVKREEYTELLEPDHVFDRITQYTDLEADTLRYDLRVRSHLRKAERSGILIEERVTRSILEDFWTVYKNNMDRLGLDAKTMEQFQKYRELFHEKAKFKFAFFDGKMIAAIVYLIFGNTAFSAETVCLNEYKTLNPNTLLIDRALKECKAVGLKYWNWGASEHRGNPVYKFKEAFGPFDVEYSYVTKVLKKDDLKKIGLNNMKKHFGWYYVAPYSFFH